MSVRLLTAEEVAFQLGIELDTLYRYARAGQIRGLKLGNLWRFAEADVESFVAARRAATRVAPKQTLKLLTDVLGHDLSDRTGGLVCGAIRTSYSDVEVRSTRLALALQRAGVSPGDRVLVILPTCTEFLITCFAAWRIGAVVVPEFTGIRPASLAHVLGDSRPIAMVIDGSVAQRISETPEIVTGVRTIFIRESTFTLSGLEGAVVHSLSEAIETDAPGGRLAPRAASPDDVVSIQYTSGSTGLPKGVMHTHASTLAGTEFTRQYHNVSATDRIVISLPLHHGLAYRQLFAYAVADADVLLAGDVYQALRMLREFRPTAMVLVPAAANLILDHFAEVLQDAAQHLRYVEVGSAAFGADRLHRLQSLLPNTRVCLPYGLTEVRVGFLDRGSEGRFNRIAAVATGLELSVVGADGAVCRAGETGNIVIRGAGLMRGYWGRDAAEAERYAHAGFPTGDMARVTADDQVELLGRVDDILKVGGRKVNPTEVELALARHPQVAEAAVAAVDDPSGVFEAVLHGFVVLKKSVELSEDSLLDFCRREIEPYKLPSKIHFRTSLPKSAVGKILRGELVKERAAG